MRVNEKEILSFKCGSMGGEGLLECVHTKAEPVPPRLIRKINCCLSNLPTCTGVAIGTW